MESIKNQNFIVLLLGKYAPKDQTAIIAHSLKFKQVDMTNQKYVINVITESLP